MQQRQWRWQRRRARRFASPAGCAGHTGISVRRGVRLIPACSLQACASGDGSHAAPSPQQRRQRQPRAAEPSPMAVCGMHAALPAAMPGARAVPAPTAGRWQRGGACLSPTPAAAGLQPLAWRQPVPTASVTASQHDDSSGRAAQQAGSQDKRPASRHATPRASQHTGRPRAWCTARRPLSASVGAALSPAAIHPSIHPAASAWRRGAAGCQPLERATDG